VNDENAEWQSSHCRATKAARLCLEPIASRGERAARLFDLLLGINLLNADDLLTALLDAARDGEAIQGKTTRFGVKYEIRFRMTSARGNYTVLSIRIVESGAAVPRLVTAYIE
jgi:hypothetical protein